MLNRIVSFAQVRIGEYITEAVDTEWPIKAGETYIRSLREILAEDNNRELPVGINRIHGHTIQGVLYGLEDQNYDDIYAP